MSDCHTCKLAKWQVGPSGRRLSKRPGECLWKGEMILPASIYWKPNSTFEGGAIWWDHDLKCAYHQK